MSQVRHRDRLGALEDFKLLADRHQTSWPVHAVVAVDE